METTRELYEKLIIKSRESKDREQGRRYRVLAYCFHPDGYTRERALRTVPDVSPKDLLWIAYHRLTDWVSPIRALAAELIESHLSVADEDELMKAYPYVVACARSERALGHFGDRYIRAFEAALIRLELWKPLRMILLGSASEEAYFAACVMTRNEQGRKHLCACFGELANAALRGRIFSVLAEKHSECLTCLIGADGGVTVLEVMLSDPLPSNRLKALMWVHHHASDDAAVDAAKNCLEDKSSVVRGQACTMLELRCPDFNAHAYYAERLKTSPVAGAVGGFADTGKLGDHADISVINELLTHAEEGNKITPALLRALHIMTPAAYPDPLPALLTPYLASPLPKVPQTVARLLMLRGHVDHEAVYTVLKNTDSPSAALSIVRVLGTVGSKWDRLVYLLRTLILLQVKKYAWEYSYSEFIAQSLINRWLITANRSFTPLTPEIALTVEGLLSLCKEKRLLDKGVADRVRFYLT